MENERQEYQPGKSPLIKNLMAGLPEIGKIKIGKKGELRKSQSGTDWRAPVKLDHLLVTRLDRDANDNFVVDSEIMKMLGSDKPKRIPIRLLFDSIEGNFQSRYVAYYPGKTLWCSGDGEAAYRVVQGKPERECVKCPCGRENPKYTGKDKCKMNGKLSCIIDGAEVVGGVWVYRTTGYNSTVGIMSSLALIRTFTGGLLAGIELDLTIQPKVATDPDGKSVTIQVVGVIYRGSMQNLQKKTLEIAHANAEFRQRLTHVDQEVQRLIGVDTDAIDQAGDINDEFYPEEAELVQPDQTTAPVTAAPVAPAPAQVQAPAPVEPAAASAPVEQPARRGRKPSQPAAAPAPAAPAPVEQKPEPKPETVPPPPLAQPEGAPEYEDMWD